MGMKRPPPKQTRTPGRKVAGIVDTFAPPIALLAKVGSILVHVDEAVGAGGHEFDWVAVRSLLADREVQEWLEGMRAKGLLPVKRT